jgi:hypothetical protein
MFEEENVTLEPVVFNWSNLLPQNPQLDVMPFLGWDHTFKWQEQDFIRSTLRNANNYITLIIDEDNEQLIFVPSEKYETETSECVGGVIYLYPIDTTYPAFSGLTEKETDYEHNMKYAECLFTQVFTYEGISYKIEVPMFED